jgi:hypothetical protein
MADCSVTASLPLISSSKYLNYSALKMEAADFYITPVTNYITSHPSKQQ